MKSYKFIGLAKLKNKDYQGAINNYSDLIEKFTDDADSYVLRGKAKFNSKDYQGAINDYSEAIEVARENFREYKNVIFIKGDIENIPFKKNSIDFFICLGVIHHLENSSFEKRLLVSFKSKLNS